MTVGAYWGRNLASGDIPWQELSQPVTDEFRRHPRSAGDFQGYEVAPPAGFEPALTAPEAVALSLSYGGYAPGKGYQSKSSPRRTQPRL